jgi:hypothetical protein
MLTALRTKLNTSTGGTGFMALYTSRVFLDAAPGDTALPLAVYAVEHVKFDKSFSGTESHILRVTFTFFEGGSDLVTGPVASDRLRTLLDGVDLVSASYDRVLCLLRQRGTPNFADDVWTVSDVYELVGQLL